MQYKFETRRLLAERPTQTQTGEAIPADAIIFNAPRDVYGNLIWFGDFCSGIFYAALSEQHPNRADVIKFNYQQNAVILLYVTDEAAKAEVRAYYIREYGDEFMQSVSDEMFDEGWRDSFYVHFALGELYLEGN